ncbi:hypothetical protein [Paraburkholderia silvatlantica]|uniref:hypothetical protein n=1 Tax=Paraburkholderia silvatlantica TaxID=321895 RepID=UPI00105B7EA9|nr:hypothetical protein [Paraburkholderia silvatlantica]TDR04459.1 hypothetical protein C7412_102370 [Paraburkholderia silvatlantica]
MEYLSQEAAKAFLFSCRASYFEGVIGRYEFVSRMSALGNIAEPTSGPSRYALKVLENEGWNAELEWTNRCQAVENSQGQDNRNNAGSSKGPGSASDLDDEGSSMSFMTEARMGFSRKWDFHKGDADPDPSVPHGHHTQDDRRKLHAYRGFIYFQGEPDGRESREAIIRLWNDAKFREFAFEAIKHFVNERPDWTWDRDPLILPSLRKGY